MLIENGPEDADYARAIRLLLFTTAQPSINVDGVNEVFSEIGETGRSGQALLALCDLAHLHAPQLRDESVVDALRRTLTHYELKLMKGTEDE